MAARPYLIPTRQVGRQAGRGDCSARTCLISAPLPDLRTLHLRYEGEIDSIHGKGSSEKVE